MNVFALDRDPVIAAQAQCDVHVSRMITKTAQALCTAASLMGYQGAPYDPFHIDGNKFSKWAMESRVNWDWLLAHGFALWEQHRDRKGTGHKSFIALCWLRNLDPYEHYYDKPDELTPFADGLYPKRDVSMYPDPSVDTMISLYRDYYARKEAKWAELGKKRCLEFVSRGRRDLSHGHRPVMKWTAPGRRMEWMPKEKPTWLPNEEEVMEALPADW